MLWVILAEIVLMSTVGARVLKKGPRRREKGAGVAVCKESPRDPSGPLAVIGQRDAFCSLGAERRAGA